MTYFYHYTELKLFFKIISYTVKAKCVELQDKCGYVNAARPQHFSALLYILIGLLFKLRDLENIN